MFSAAKTYQQLEEMNSFLVDENGKIRPYSQFKRKVDAVHKKYNNSFLQAEYQTSKRSAQATRQWKGFVDNQDLFPNLKYRTINDDKVRKEHEKLEGIIKPINDPFWETHYPPNGFRCRCYVSQTTEEVTNSKVNIKPDKGFENNVGKSNEIFTKEHPYFTYPKEASKTIEKSLKDFKKAQKAKNKKENE